jgi:hypothetical protein
MPNVNDLKTSKYLKKEDVGDGVIVTIKGYEEVNVGMQGAAPDYKWALFFNELEKPMVLNSTNGQLLQNITGSGEFDDWIGKQVVLYDDPSIAYAGKITGGIRVKAHKPARPPVPAGGRAGPSRVQSSAPRLDSSGPMAGDEEVGSDNIPF